MSSSRYPLRPRRPVTVLKAKAKTAQKSTKGPPGRRFFFSATCLSNVNLIGLARWSAGGSLQTGYVSLAKDEALTRKNVTAAVLRVIALPPGANNLISLSLLEVDPVLPQIPGRIVDRVDEASANNPLLTIHSI
jgi:hypothetical protein